MEWIEAKIFTTTAGIEPVTGRLMQMGITGFAIEDAADFNEFLNETSPRWDYVDDSLMELTHCETNIKIYLPNTLQGMESISNIRADLAVLKKMDDTNSFGRLEMVLENLNEEDWATAWKKYYHPVRVGEHIVVCPSWETYTQQEGDITLILDPGMAFGTGTHHTTVLCMELLEKYAAPGKSMLDIGCGSGILAITAALLDCEGIVGVDIDETAVRVARENAVLNFITSKIIFHQGDLAAKVKGKFDIICANIVADVIIRLLPDLHNFLNDDGIFICSGIIDERKDDVLTALTQNGMKSIEIREAGGWVAISNV
ncbi:MAG: 50S ribosomal protein L11 methyltransferase, partial [Oscillospiraceae bacterium]